MTRKHLLGLLAALSFLAPSVAVAQVCPAVAALPDSERRVAYSPSASTGPFSIPFSILGDSTDYGAWVEVWLNNVRLTPVNDWQLTIPSGTLAAACRPITNASVTLTTAATGTLQIVGARRPRRTSQFPENLGVSARNLNQVFTDRTAQNRETWDKINDVTGRALIGLPGESITTLPSATNRASKFLGFDATGLIPTMATIANMSGGVTCSTAGDFVVSTGLGSQCSTTAGSTARLGATADVYDFRIAQPATAAAALLSMQLGKSGNLYAPGASSNAISLQALFNVGTGAGLGFFGVASEARCQAGTNGSCIGGQFYGIAELANTQPGTLGGAQGVYGVGKSDVGGDVFGGSTYAWCQTVAGRSCIGAEFDVDIRVNGYGARKGVQIVSVSTNTGTIADPNNDVAVHILAQTGGAGFANAFRLGDSASAAAISTGGTILSSRQMTISSGFDLSLITMSSGRWVISKNAHYVTSYNAAGLAVKKLIGLDGSDLVSIYDGALLINSSGAVTTGSWAGTNIPLNNGGTNAALTASLGGIFYSTASAGAILYGTATAGQMFQSGASAAPTW